MKLSVDTTNNGYLFSTAWNCSVLSSVFQTEALSQIPSVRDAELSSYAPRTEVFVYTQSLCWSNFITNLAVQHSLDSQNLCRF